MTPRRRASRRRRSGRSEPRRPVRRRASMLAGHGRRRRRVAVGMHIDEVARRPQRRQMAAPMPPLPPVTKARVAGCGHVTQPFCWRRKPRWRGRQQPPRLAPQFEFDTARCCDRPQPARHRRSDRASMSSSRSTCSRTSRRPARKPASARGRAALPRGRSGAASAPCTAMACAAYSMPQQTPKRPCAQQRMTGTR